MYGCGEQEVGEQEAGVPSGSGWNLWVWLLGVIVRRYIDFLILLIPTPLVSSAATFSDFSLNQRLWDVFSDSAVAVAFLAIL